MTPHPVGTYESPIKLDNPVGNGRPRTYVVCTDPLHRPVEEAQRWAKAQAGRDWRELATAHDCMITAPADVAALSAPSTRQGFIRRDILTLSFPRRRREGGNPGQPLRRSPRERYAPNVALFLTSIKT